MSTRKHARNLRRAQRTVSDLEQRIEDFLCVGAMPQVSMQESFTVPCKVPVSDDSYCRRHIDHVMERMNVEVTQEMACMPDLSR